MKLTNAAQLGTQSPQKQFKTIILNLCTDTDLPVNKMTDITIFIYC